MTPFSVIQILSCILAGFCSTKWLAECSDLSKTDANPHDSLPYRATSMDEEVSNLEATTILPDYGGQVRGSRESVEEDFLKAEPIIADPVFEDVSSNNSDDKKSNSKRDAFHGNWKHWEKMQILQLHNLHRGNVTPPAGNMAYMEWDVELERLAQIWANNCSRQSGGHATGIGQNIDINQDPTAFAMITRWFEERRDFDLRTGYCIPNKQCLRYVQMAWAESTKVGCAVAKCELYYFFVCNYSPGAKHGAQMYRVAEPCSLCSGKNVLCLKNLCMTPEQCKNNPFACQEAECNLKCHNCGRLDKETCTCECTDGWDDRDCSYLCKNKHARCGKKPHGYPDKDSCSSQNYAVAKTECREMCGMCPAMQNTSNNTCCGTKLCEEGYVFDPSGKSCKCVLLCPGPICDEKEPSLAAVIGGGAESLRTFPCITIWMVFLKFIEIYLRKHT